MQTQWGVIIEILKRISDLQFQKSVWVERKCKHPLFNFGETVNTLGDYFFFDSINKRELNLDKDTYEILDNYIEKLLAYKEPKKATLMLEDKKWKDIVLSTQKIIRILENNTNNASNHLSGFYAFNEDNCK